MIRKRIIVENILLVFIRVFYNQLIQYVIIKLGVFLTLIYSCYIKTLLKQLDSYFSFEYPVILKGGKYIEIGKGFSSRARLRIEAWDQFRDCSYKPCIKIGDNVIINFDCHIGAINLIQIGNNVLIGSHVLITDHNHGEISKQIRSLPPSERPLHSKGAVIIEDNVWIGEGVAILANVRIGKNSIIGANAVVNADIPENSVVGGIPARVIKNL